MSKYIILRDRNQEFRNGLPPIGGIGALEVPGGQIPPEPQIETADMTGAEARNAERDPTVLEIARSMPTRLIAPTEEAEAAAGGTPTWGVDAVGAVDSDFTGAGVPCAVLDTGVDDSHAAFQGVTLVQRDFSGDGDGDVNGHGTHCAGTVFGRDVNGTRIGVAPGVTTAFIGKVLGNDGSGGSEMLFDAMQWASENGARVMSMSLGFDFPGLAERLQQQFNFPPALATSVALEAYRMNLRVFDRLLDLFRARAAFNGGTVVCAASGNESRREISPEFEVSASVPAAAEGAVSVGALQQTGAGLKVADFSNTNPTLSAPGVGVVSARSGGGLRSLSGTSMACPHVAGVAALWWEALAGAGLPLNNRAVEARMLTTAARDGFAPGVQVADRGQGLIRAPMAAMF